MGRIYGELPRGRAVRQSVNRAGLRLYKVKIIYRCLSRIWEGDGFERAWQDHATAFAAFEREGFAGFCGNRPGAPEISDFL